MYCYFCLTVRNNHFLLRYQSVYVVQMPPETIMDKNLDGHIVSFCFKDNLI